MKMLWSIVSFLAVVHLLAVLMFAGWLWQSGRLSGDRLERIRTMLATTVADDEQASRDRAGEDESQRAAAVARQRESLPPVTSESQIGLLWRVDERAAVASRRLVDEQRQLLTQIDQRRVELEQQVRAFETARTNWIAAVGAEQQRKTDEQFLKAVAQYETIPAKQAKQMIQELVAQNQKLQAVAYLDAMDGRAAKKILSEFTGPQEIQLATELLERLRTFGTPAAAPEVSDASKDARHAQAAVDGKS